MARIMSQESSLTRRRQSLARETRLLRVLFRVEVALAGVLWVTGSVWYFRSGQATLFWWGCAAAVVCGAHALRVRQNAREDRIVAAGLRGETEVTRRLHAALDRTHYVFNDVQLAFGRSRGQIDHLVVCPQGVFVIETKNWRGRLVGTTHADRWQQFRKRGEAPVHVSNPIRQVQRQAAMLTGALKRAGFDAIPIIPLVVFLSAHTTLEVESPAVPLLSPAACVDMIARHTGASTLGEDQVSGIVEWLERATAASRGKRS